MLYAVAICAVLIAGLYITARRKDKRIERKEWPPTIGERLGPDVLRSIRRKVG